MSEPVEALAEPSRSVPVRYASAEDFEECRRLHRRFGTTYYFASRRFPKAVRQRVDALYGFVRVPDEWVDNPEGRSPAERLKLLEAFRDEMLEGLRGRRPEHPVLRAFCQTALECGIDQQEPLLFLEAMMADTHQTRYATYADLEHYMRGSASAVGLMMCRVVEAPRTASVERAAIRLGEAMQMTNFLRDVGEDWRRDRLYLPLEDLDRFGVSEADISAGRVSPDFVSLMQFEIQRTRDLYGEADPGIPMLPAAMQVPVRMARVLYSRILDRIEQNGYDVFRVRARTSRAEKIAVAAQMLLGRGP